MELEKLMKLLAGFVMFAGYRNKEEKFMGSPYGFKMDIAVAKDLMGMLIFYGADPLVYKALKDMLQEKGLWDLTESKL